MFTGEPLSAKGSFALGHIPACTRTFEIFLSPELPGGSLVFTGEPLSAKGGNSGKRSKFSQMSDLPKFLQIALSLFFLTNRLFYFVLLCNARQNKTDDRPPPPVQC